MPLNDLLLPTSMETVPSDTVRINLGILTEEKKVVLEFSVQLKTISLTPDRARKLALAMLQCVDALDPSGAGRA